MGILWLAIKTIGSLFVMACALRAYLQVLRLPAQNPLSRLTFQMTDWIVLPLRRVFPGFGGFDWASFLAALLLSLALTLLFYFFMTFGLLTEFPVEKPVRPFGWLVALALIWAMSWFVQLCVVILIVNVLMSWLSPMHPLKPVMDLLVSPFLLPFRRLLGGVRRSGFDLSPIGGFLMLQITAAVLSEFESSVMRHLF
jgi:YggT family protein